MGIYIQVLLYCYMQKALPLIVIVEDDQDDVDIISAIFASLPVSYELKFFEHGKLALQFLEETQSDPFMIISDINMPIMNGYELKKMLYENTKLSLRCIPFLFMSTSGDEKIVNQAYTLSAQGYFLKPYNIPDFKIIIKRIVDYWENCLTPTSFRKLI